MHYISINWIIQVFTHYLIFINGILFVDQWHYGSLTFCGCTFTIWATIWSIAAIIVCITGGSSMSVKAQASCMKVSTSFSFATVQNKRQNFNKVITESFDFNGKPFKNVYLLHKFIAWTFVNWIHISYTFRNDSLLGLYSTADTQWTWARVTIIMVQIMFTTLFSHCWNIDREMHWSVGMLR